MSLASIVSSIVKKEPKADRKKLAYMFKDHDMFKPKSYSLGLLLRLLNPETVTVVNVQEFPAGTEPDTKNEDITKMVSVLFPEAETIIVNATIDISNDMNTIALNEDAPIRKEQLMLTDVGLFIDRYGRIYAYKGDYVPNSISFEIISVDDDLLKELRDLDLETVLPTKGMYFVSDLVRNPKTEIAIYHFGDDDKRSTVNRVTQITVALLNAYIKTSVQVVYDNDDFKHEPEGETVHLFDGQHDFILAIRGSRIDVHLPYENGHVRKEPDGWLFLN